MGQHAFFPLPIVTHIIFVFLSVSVLTISFFKKKYVYKLILAEDILCTLLIYLSKNDLFFSCLGVLEILVFITTLVVKNYETKHIELTDIPKPEPVEEEKSAVNEHKFVPIEPNSQKFNGDKPSIELETEQLKQDKLEEEQESTPLKSVILEDEQEPVPLKSDILEDEQEPAPLKSAILEDEQEPTPLKSEKPTVNPIKPQLRETYKSEGTRNIEAALERMRKNGTDEKAQEAPVDAITERVEQIKKISELYNATESANAVEEKAEKAPEFDFTSFKQVTEKPSIKKANSFEELEAIINAQRKNKH